MPFQPQYEEVYREVYRPVSEGNGLSCWRVDEIYRPGSITRDIVEGILDAHVIIADLTSKNANVFYELGIAHAAGNKTIMTAQSSEDVPFDIRNYRVLFYEQSESGFAELRALLSESIRQLLEALGRTSNPFQEVIATRTAAPIEVRTPLVRYFNLVNLPEAITSYLRQKDILSAEDLTKLNLEELPKLPGVRQSHLEYFVSVLLLHRLYSDASTLQDFILRHRLRTGEPLPRSRWRLTF